MLFLAIMDSLVLHVGRFVNAGITVLVIMLMVPVGARRDGEEISVNFRVMRASLVMTVICNVGVKIMQSVILLTAVVHVYLAISDSRVLTYAMKVCLVSIVPKRVDVSMEPVAIM